MHKRTKYLFTKRATSFAVLSALCFVTPSFVSAYPDVDNFDVSWPTGGWYQLQNSQGSITYCQTDQPGAVQTNSSAVSLGGSSCRLPVAGQYKIKNFSPSSEWQPFSVPQAASTGESPAASGSGGTYTTYTGPVTTFSGSDTVVVRNKSQAQFFAGQNRELDNLLFGHKNANETIYGAAPEDVTLEPGAYNEAAHEPGMVGPWGSYDSNTGLTVDNGNEFNYTSGVYKDGNEGNFRIECQWSHFSFDDPIVNHEDGERIANQSHLHMYWGNTAMDYSTTLVNKDDPNYVTKKGGSTCQGYGLNRSSYWMPALMHNDNLAMAPHEIIVYYKSRGFDAGDRSDVVTTELEDIVKMPQGLQLIVGNGDRDGTEFSDAPINLRNLNKRVEIFGGVSEHKSDGDNWTWSPYIGWMCGRNGEDYRKFNRIPTAAEWQEYCVDDPTTADDDEAFANGPLFLNATVYFPQCRRPSNADDITDLDSPNFRDHVKHTQTTWGCPNGAENARMPQLGYRVYWDIQEFFVDGSPLSLDNLRLSSDPSSTQFTETTLTRDQLRTRHESAPDGFQLATPRGNLTGWSWRVGRGLLSDSNYTQTYRSAMCGGEERVPGGTLHADWVAGWHDGLQELWLDNCSRDSVNCTLGQTGTNLKLLPDSMDYHGHPMTFEKSDGTSIDIDRSYMLQVPNSGMHMCSDGADTMPPVITPVITPEPSGEVQLITDGGFQVGNIGQTTWTNTGNTAVVTMEWQGVDHSDGADARSALVTNRLNRWDGIEQSVVTSALNPGIEQGQQARLTAYVKLQRGDATGRARIRIQVLDENSIINPGASRWTTHNLEWVNVNGWSWTKLEDVWPVSWVGDLNTIKFRIDGVNAREGFRVDDASFVVE